MRTALKLFSLLLTATTSVCAQSPAQPPPTRPPSHPRSITYCDLARDPTAYNHDLLRMTAFVTHGFENFGIDEPNCTNPSEYFSIWVMYGGTAGSNTMYCCPGEAAQQTRAQSLTVEGIQLPLTADRVFQQFRDLLNHEADTTVRATIVGRFFSGPKRIQGSKTLWQGFGHMGCCSLFVIERVESFELHTRTDLDYTSEAGSNEPDGCKSESLEYKRTVSIPDWDKNAEQAISEQKLADSGERSWAFSDPQRVAVDSLKSIYNDQTPVLRRVKQTPRRQVFQWKHGKTSVIVVVTRPYWLSVYAKSSSVAWVSTMIKEAACH